MVIEKKYFFKELLNFGNMLDFVFNIIKWLKFLYGKGLDFKYCL